MPSGRMTFGVKRDRGIVIQTTDLTIKDKVYLNTLEQGVVTISLEEFIRNNNEMYHNIKSRYDN